MPNAGIDEVWDSLLSLQNQITRMGGRDGDDLFQDVVLKAQAKGYSHAGSIFLTAKTCLIDRRRKENSRRHLPIGPVFDLKSADYDPQHELDIKEMKKALDSAIDLLPPKYRDAIRLHFHESLTDQQIADRCSIPAETVRTRRKRALKMLKGKFQTNSK